MARGGYRPGCGRPKGATDKKQRKRRGGDKKPAKKPGPAKKPELKPAESDLQDRIKKLLDAGKNAKAKAFRDLVAKVAAGQTLTPAEAKTMIILEKELSAAVEQNPAEVPPDIAADAEAAELTPLEYMLKIINDTHADPERRDKLAIAAAPFFHDKPGSKSKKADRDDRARTAGAGKYSAGKPPLRRVK